jgi:probable F420-dependent oxidoreductase
VEQPFHFGAHLDLAGSPAEWDDKIRRVEGLGFDTVVMSDHLGGQLAPVPALALAAGCSSLRLAVAVFGNGLRHPAMLAKETATLDLLSGGRLMVGLGAGWNAQEYAGAGMVFDPPAVRVAKVQEAVAVLKGLWGAGPFHFHGKHYRVDMDGDPKPAQRPHPPLILPGHGHRMLDLAAREADIVDLPGRGVAADEVAATVARLRASAGVRSGGLELSTVLLDASSRQPRKGAEELAARWRLPAGRLADSPSVLLGPKAAMVEALLARRERLGISFVIVPEAVIPCVAPAVERLAGT